MRSTPLARTILLLTLTVCTVFWVGCTLTGCRAVPTPSAPVGVQTAAEAEDGCATVYVPSDREAKVLALTDLALDPTRKDSIVGADNDTTIRLLERMLDATQPDLVLLMGDFAITDTLNNWRYFRLIADVFEARQIPWSFAFGAHDCPDEYVNTLTDADSLLGQMPKARFIDTIRRYYAYCLIDAGDCDEGVGNHVVNVRNAQGALLQSFFLLDCVRPDGAITAAQLRWYTDKVHDLSLREGGTIPSVMCLHTPPAQAYRAYLDQGACLAGHWLTTPDAQEESATLLPTLTTLGSTHTVLFGRYADNDAHLAVEGIHMAFVQHSGWSTAYRITHDKDFALLFWPTDVVFDLSRLATYGDCRGGTLLTLRQDRTTDLRPLYARDLVSDYGSLVPDVDAITTRLKTERGEEAVILP